MKNNMYDSEDRDYKFDARLRYVENLMDAWIVFIQSDNDRRTNPSWTPRSQAEFERAVLNLFNVLKLHDPELELPKDNDFTNEDFIDKLKTHHLVRNLTDNVVKKNEPGQAIKNKFQT